MALFYDIYLNYLTTEHEELSCRYYNGMNRCYEELPDAKKYILHYFKIGEKLQCWEDLPILKDMRYKHMFSLFLFGLYCYDNIRCIREAVNAYMKQLLSRKDMTDPDGINLRWEFLYFWFLITLYHDVGSTQEEKEIRVTKIKQWEDKNSFSLYKIISMYPDVVNSGLSGVPRCYIDRAEKYFIEFRGKIQRKHDHGFYAAVDFFEKMSSLHGKEIIINGKHFSPDILKWQVYPVALSILMHNIWTKFTTDQETNEKGFYEKNMPELITEPGKPLIDLNHHPFLFLLTLADTIEPIKMFSRGRVNFNEILHYITIEVRDEKVLTLTYPQQFYKNCRYFKEELYNSRFEITEFLCGRRMKCNLAFLENEKLKINYDYNKLIIHFDF